MTVGPPRTPSQPSRTSVSIARSWTRRAPNRVPRAETGPSRARVSERGDGIVLDGRRRMRRSPFPPVSSAPLSIQRFAHPALARFARTKTSQVQESPARSSIPEIRSPEAVSTALPKFAKMYPLCPPSESQPIVATTGDAGHAICSSWARNMLPYGMSVPPCTRTDPGATRDKD